MTVDLLLARLRRGVLDLAPDFQRHAGIWNEVNQSRLIESLLLRIPLPTLYAAESGEESWAVVDGIQRLTTIARFVDPATIGEVPLRLRGLEYLGYNGKLYTDLPGAMQTRIDETELIIHLIRAGTPEAVKFNGQPTTNPYRPTNVGFGLTYVLPVVLACLTAQPDAMLLLENPEAHLHPRGQSRAPSS
jgi:hypothetical protein